MMPPDFLALKEAAAANTWLAIYPELALGLLALALLALEILLPRSRRRLIPRVAFIGQVALLAWVVATDLRVGAAPELSFGGLLLHDGLGQGFRVFFLLASALVTWLGMMSLDRQRLPQVEFFHILLVVTAAMMLLVQSHHFVMLFVALETVTVSSYVLVSYFRHTGHSLEAGLKYLIMGALSSAMLTFGIVLLYGVAGNPAMPGAAAKPLDFIQLRAFLEVNPDNVLAIAGMLLVLCGIAFKAGAFPFQIWIPDVYQGAPTPVTAFLAISSKAAGIGVLLKLVTFVFVPLNAVLLPVFGVVTAATILFGNFAALTQRNTKRLMGLSGISHAGYVMLGILAATVVPWAGAAVLFYLFTYMLASIAIFAVLTHLSDSEDAGLETDDFVDLGRKHPLLGGVLAVGLGSLAGIPPLAGFIGKALIFVAAFKAELYGLFGIAIIGAILSIYYYFGWMKLALFEFTRIVPQDVATKELEVRPMPLGGRFLLGAIALATLVLGIFQGPLSAWVSFN